MTKKISKLHHDAAQALPERDQFGFRDLADQLAANILSLLESGRSDGGFALGVEGRWGSGKSTILNYLRYSLRAALDPEKQFLIDFDPWWLEDDANIVSALLSSVLDALPQGEAQKAATAVGKLAGAVSKLPEGVDVLLRLSKKTEGVADLIGATREAGGDLSKLLNAAKPVRKLRDDVAEAFGDKSYTFVVLIDDLDRLPPDKAIRVMNAIKSIADLPGFVYVLAYDPAALGNILKSYKPPLGTDYFEKIINVSVPVPPLTTSQMEGFVSGLLSPGLRDPLLASPVHRSALLRVLEAPRDAIRLANSANFWIDGKTAELHAPDFLLLEAIRLAWPPAYSGILKTSHIWLNSESSDFLSRTLGETDRRKEMARQAAAEVADALQLAETSRAKGIRAALSVLFPKAATYLGSAGGFGDFFETAPDVPRSIARSGHFFTYFLHRPLPGTPSRNEIDKLISPKTLPDERRSLVSEISRRPVGDVTPLRQLIALLEGERDHGGVDTDTVFQLVEALVAPTTYRRPSAGAPRYASDLMAVRAFVMGSMQTLKRLTDQQVASLSDERLDLEVQGNLHILLAAGTPHYLLADQIQERVVQASDTALSKSSQALVDRVLAGIADDTVFSVPDAGLFLFMAHKHSPALFAAAIAPVFADDARTVALVECHQGYSNPIPTLSAFANLDADALKRRMEAAFLAMGRQMVTWNDCGFSA